MKRYTLGIITGACLVGASAFADDKDVNKVNPTTGGRKDGGVDTSSTVGKIKQGAKNIFTELKFEDLPLTVQAQVRQQSGGTKINDIDREDRSGQTVYEIEFDRDGANQEIHVAEDGTLIPETATGLTRTDKDSDKTTGADRTTIRANMSPKFADLPTAVQRTVQQHGSQSDIEDIDRESRDGRVVYEIEFRREGANREIVVAEDGALIKNEAVGRPGAGRDSVIGSDRTPILTPGTVPPANNIK